MSVTFTAVEPLVGVASLYSAVIVFKFNAFKPLSLQVFEAAVVLEVQAETLSTVMLISIASLIAPVGVILNLGKPIPSLSVSTIVPAT